MIHKIMLSEKDINLADMTTQDRYGDASANKRVHIGHMAGIGDDIRKNRYTNGTRAEIAALRWLENCFLGVSIKWFGYKQNASRDELANKSDIVFGKLEIDVKSKPYDSYRFLIPKYHVKEMHRHRIYILVNMARFPSCELIGWVTGSDIINRCSTDSSMSGPTAWVVKETIAKDCILLGDMAHA